MNAVKFFHPTTTRSSLILSGSVDQTIRLWQIDSALNDGYKTVAVLEGHTGSINCINVSPGRPILASGAADATIMIWRVGYEIDRWETLLLQTIETRPKFIPLTIALSALGSDDLLLAAAGTKADIYVYATRGEPTLAHQQRSAATKDGYARWRPSQRMTNPTVTSC